MRVTKPNNASAFLSNGVDDRVVTASGTGTMNAETNLTFDGSELIVTGDAEISGRTQLNAVVKADNETAGTLAKGTPVYVSATHASGRPSIDETDASGSGTYPAIGLVWADITAGSSGHVLGFGVLEDVAAARFVGSDPSVGDTIYLATTAGKLTVDRPTGKTDEIQNIGHITKTNVSVSGGTGTANIVVENAGRTNDTPNSISAYDTTLTCLVTDLNPTTTHVLDINFDKTGVSTSNNTMIGINVDMDNVTADSGTNDMTAIKVTPTCQNVTSGNVTVKGLEVIATGSSPGTTIARALDLTSTGADFCQGLFLKIDDGKGPDIKMLSSAVPADNTTITTGSAGSCTIETTGTVSTVENGVTSLSSNTGSGDIVSFGAEDVTETLSAGKLMYLDSAGTWKYAKADGTEAEASSLLAVALGTSVSDGLLLRGYFHFGTIDGVFAQGAPAYISPTDGNITFTQPSTVGQFSRTIAYGTTTSGVCYFCPDNTFIEL